MADNKTLQILLTAKDEASKVLSKFDGALASTGKTLQNAGAFLGKVALGIGAVGAVAVAGAKQMVDAFAESEAEMSIANTAIKTFSEKTMKDMGGSFDTAKVKVEEFGNSMQNKLGFGGESASVAITKLTQATGDWNKAQELFNLSADLARYKQIDLGTAVSAVSKMVNGSTKELNALGIETDKNSTSQQNLAMLMNLTAGQAEAYAGTIQGQTDILKEKFGDLQENIGQLLLPVVTKLFEGLNAIIPIAQQLITTIAGLITKIAESETTKAIILIVKNAFNELWLAVMQLWEALQPYMPFLQMLAQLIGAVLLGAFIAVIKVIQWFIQLLTALLDMFKTVYKFIKENLIQAIGTDIGNAVNAMGKAFEWVKGVVKNVFDGIKSFIQPVIDTVNGLIDKLQAVKNMAGNVVSGVSNAVSGAISSVGNVFGGGKAGGGSVSAGKSYTVGENGREMFIPNQNGTIIPNKNLGGGSSITVIVQGNQLLDDRAGDKIGEMIINKLKYQANLN